MTTLALNHLGSSPASTVAGWVLGKVKDGLAYAGGNASALDIELATIAAWCAAHGLAEMASFKQFEPLKAAMGGEENFLRGVLEHIRVFQRPD